MTASSEPTDGRRPVSIGRRVIALGVAWLVTGAVMRVTLLAPEVCPALTADEAHATAVAAVDWIVDNQRPSGRYLYELNRDTGATPARYNLVRHAGTTMAVYQAVAAGEYQYLDAADRATAYMLDRMVETGDGAASWAERGEDLQLGSAALMALALLIRRDATGDPAYDEDLRRLGRFMRGQQLDDGVMLEIWRRDTGAPDPDRRSRYATGEALWAFAFLHETFPGEGWDEAAWPTLDYLSLRRDDEEQVFPNPWPDQWAAYSLGQMADWGLEDHHVEYARRLAGQFGVQVRWDSQRGDALSTLVHQPEPRGAGFGTVLEGLASLRVLAETDARVADLADPLGERLVCGASRLADAQTTAETVMGDEPALEIGAWFRNGETRMDDQQHAASAMLFAEAVLEERP
jgi:hypothetical protein